MARLKTPTRTIHNAGIGRVIGWFYSHKNQTAIPWESQIERDYLYLCEFTKWVLSVVAQPETIELWVNGKRIRYTSDFYIERQNGIPLIVEVKPDKYRNEEEYQALFQAARSYYQKRDCEFREIRASEIRRGYLIANLHLLYYYATWPVSDREKKIISELFSQPSAPILLVDVIEVLYRNGSNPGVVYRLLFDQYLGTDLESERLSPAARIWRNC